MSSLQFDKLHFQSSFPVVSPHRVTGETESEKHSLKFNICITYAQKWFLVCPRVLWGKLIIYMICFLHVCAMCKHWRVELWQTGARIPLVCYIKSQKKLTNVTFHARVVPLRDYRGVGKIHRMIYNVCVKAIMW